MLSFEFGKYSIEARSVAKLTDAFKVLGKVLIAVST